MPHRRDKSDDEKNETKIPEILGDYTDAAWEDDKVQICMMTWWCKKSGGLCCLYARQKGAADGYVVRGTVAFLRVQCIRAL